MQGIVSLLSALGVIITGVFIAYKLMGQLAWSWFWVLCPLFAGIAFIAVVLMFADTIRGTSESFGHIGAFFSRRRKMRAIMEMPDPQPERAPPEDSATWWQRRGK